jgi:thioredoxin reductase (NADPH)
MNDVLIIGKGSAGLASAIYVLRAGLKAVLVGKDAGALSRAEKIENYFGMPKPISGNELLEIGYKQVEDLGGQIIEDEILDITWDNGFVASGRLAQYTATAVILATGAPKKTLPIQGLEAFEGKGVSYCAVCDGFFYRGKSVAVIGSGDNALYETKELAAVAKHVTLLTNAAPMTADFSGIQDIIDEPISRVTGDERVERIAFNDGREISVDGIFMALGSAGAVDLARRMGAQVSGNRVVVDEEMATAVPGLFAAGDCTGGLAQVATAVAKGAIAAMSAARFVRASK